MLAAVKKGRPVNEAEIPPPVATGAPKPPASRPAVPQRPAPPVPSRPRPAPSDQQGESEAATSPSAVPEIITPSSEEEPSSSATLLTPSSLPSPEQQAEEPADLPPASLTDGQFHLD